jgi:hypothetical protein
VTAISRPKIDKTAYERHGLTWTSSPLAIPTEMTGYARITFWASFSSSDTDFVVEVTDVEPDDESGRFRSLQVTRGYLNAIRYFSRSNPQPLTSGHIYQFGVELYPTSYVFRAGHRIRVSLQGAAFDPHAKPPALMPPGFAGVDPALLNTPQGPGLNVHGARVSIFQDAEHPSFVDLPIIGTGTLSACA